MVLVFAQILLIQTSPLVERATSVEGTSLIIKDPSVMSSHRKCPGVIKISSVINVGSI